MNLNIVRCGVLCVAGFSATTLVAAQQGSSMSNNQPNQPNQQQNQQQNNTAMGTGMAGTMSGAAGANDPTGQMMKDKMFLRKAGEGGLAEVQLGQLAAQKGSSDDVKQFAQKMVDDHTMLNNSLKPIADDMGVRVPTKLTKKDQAEYDKLNGLSGDDFDKEYLAYMVKDHHEDVRDFRDEDEQVTDSNLKPAVEKGLRVIRDHTRMVDKLAKAKGVATPGRGGATAPPAQ
ncbi:DUF4142 domain-containing protein [Granulicella arctica]|uniref:DUF4142 domain-containing protein n=1 Tax=Granulicella arctica TaxID=940613 RepID=UPI0021E0D63E|nr:DUF4142 domain-containing protein [Granulicella arctica]